jgi:hypothetical protein
MANEPAEGAISQVVTVLRTVSGIDSVPLNPPTVMSYKTFGLVYPFTGNFNFGSPTGTKRGLHNIAIDILTTNMDFARTMSLMKPFIDTVALELGRQISYDSDSNPGQKFNNTIDTFSGLDYSWIASADYGGVLVTGLHFIMTDVKILTSL